MNEDEESSQSYQKIEDNFVEEGENELKKVDITGYRYKIKNRIKQLELKNELLSEINIIKKKLLLNENYKDNEKEDNKDIIHKKIEINTTLESNYIPKNEYNYNNKTYNLKNNNKNRILSCEKDVNDNFDDNRLMDNHFKNQNDNISEIIFNKNRYINTSESLYKNNINSKDNNLGKITEKQNNMRMNSNYINNTYSHQNQIQIGYPKINNLIDYKYYYVNKKNRKSKKFKKLYKTKEFADINNLVNDFIKIKNERKKRFHRDIKQKAEEA